MRHFNFIILLNIINVFCEAYSTALQLSIYPKKVIEFEDLSLGRVSLISRNRRFYIKKHSKYFHNKNGELKLGTGKTKFKFEESFFGTQIKSEELCITAESGNLILKQCCTDDEFCITRQSFLITYFNDTEDSNDESEDLVDLFNIKHPNFKGTDSELVNE